VTEQEGNQWLFISFAQNWCQKARDGYLKQLLATDPHAPGQWRANGALMNNDEFAKVFQYKADSKMNPTTKCKLW
jgi:predicted metalloendopeptidase